MPEFSTSLGCLNPPHIYKGGKQVISVPVGQHKNKGDHSLDFRGSAVGTVTLAQGPADLKEIKYELTLGSELASTLDKVILDYPTPEEVADNTKSSRFQLVLPSRTPENADFCTRFDVTIFLPASVQTLHVQSHATTQIAFAAGAQLDLDALFVTTYGLNTRNMLLPSAGVRARKTKLQMTRGWLVGDVAVLERAELVTQSRMSQKRPLSTTANLTGTRMRINMMSLRMVLATTTANILGQRMILRWPQMAVPRTAMTRNCTIMIRTLT